MEQKANIISKDVLMFDHLSFLWLFFSVKNKIERSIFWKTFNTFWKLWNI